jgi:hypothetical protein
MMTDFTVGGRTAAEYIRGALYGLAAVTIWSGWIVCPIVCQGWLQRKPAGSPPSASFHLAFVFRCDLLQYES